jgi:hypothetical protein
MYLFLSQIAAWSFLAFAALLFAVLVVSYGVGFIFARLRKRRDPTEPEGIGLVVGGITGLLAFVLALTLSFANSRVDERRMGALSEANAIGTAWLRAHAIGHERGPVVAALLEDYAAVRRDFVGASHHADRLAQLNARTGVLQGEIWGHFAAIVREQPNPVAVALQAALNETFDAATAERYAFEQRLPQQVFWLLIGMSVMGMGSLGFQLGLRDRAAHGLVVLLMLTWTVVIVEILDLSAPRIGTLRVGTAPYDWTIDGFKGGFAIPPMPPRR